MARRGSYNGGSLRRYGSGSLRETEPGSGVWRARWWIEDLAAPGASRQVSTTLGSRAAPITRTQAEKQLQLMMATGEPPVRDEPAPTPTVGDLLTTWLARQGDKQWAPKTEHENRRAIETRIRPALGHVVLDRLTLTTLQDAFDVWERATSASSAHRYAAVLLSALRWGKRRDEYAVAIPSDVLGARGPAQPRATTAKLTSADIDTLVRTAERFWRSGWGWESQLAKMIRLAFVLGCRLGELLALRWEDVDLTTGRVSISRSLTEVAGKVTPKTTKTGRERIAQAVPSQLVEILGVESGTSSGYLFTDRGGPVSPHKVTDGFARVRKAAGLSCTFHDIRHASASYLITAGVPIPNVSRQLGHASVRTTLDIYTHALPATVDEHIIAAMTDLQPATPALPV
jgi:integrase